MKFTIYCLISLFINIEVHADVLSKISAHIQKILGSKDLEIKLPKDIQGNDFKNIKFNEDYSSFNVNIEGKNVSGIINWKVKIPVLKSLKRSNELIDDSDIELKEFNLNDISKDVCLKKEEIISHTSSLIIKPGLPISKNYLKIPYAIKKGEKVTILLKRPSFVVQTQGIAVQNGVIGEVILVEPSDSSNKKIKVKVESQGICSL